MKLYLVVLVLGLAWAQEAEKKEKPAPAEEDNADADEPKPRIFRRMIPADTLRDFPNYCFASTSCKLYEPSQDWDLAPFCGRSHCMFEPESKSFIEVVFDCGPKPTNPDHCKILRSGNTTASFPRCCDVYDLESCEFPLPQLSAPENRAPPPEGAAPTQGKVAGALEEEEPKRPGRPGGRRQ